MTNEGTIRWRPNESTKGDAAGSGASGQAPGRAELRSQAPTVSGELVRTTRSQGASHGSSTLTAARTLFVAGLRATGSKVQLASRPAVAGAETSASRRRHLTV